MASLTRLLTNSTRFRTEASFLSPAQGEILLSFGIMFSAEKTSRCCTMLPPSAATISTAKTGAIRNTSSLARLSTTTRMWLMSVAIACGASRKGIIAPPTPRTMLEPNSTMLSVMPTSMKRWLTSVDLGT